MVRAPCCEKMGLKKGPWTAEEDQILVSHIHRFGHGNWRALPKHAGLLRCGKSCRLRWTNYLRPDIKRGNFTQEEEDTIINLHELLGNRWSAIAARLPGRTDNEIKNVWHTHLKKRVTPKPTSPEPTKKGGAAGMERPAAPATVNVDATASTPRSRGSALSSAATANCSSPAASSSSSSTTTTTVTRETVDTGCPPENFLEEVMIESFWSGTLSLDSCDTSMDYIVESDGSQMLSSSCHGGELTANATFSGDDMDLWLRLFMEAVELPELPTM